MDYESPFNETKCLQPMFSGSKGVSQSIEFVCGQLVCICRWYFTILLIYDSIEVISEGGIPGKVKIGPSSNFVDGGSPIFAVAHVQEFLVKRGEQDDRDPENMNKYRCICKKSTCSIILYNRDVPVRYFINVFDLHHGNVQCATSTRYVN